MRAIIVAGFACLLGACASGPDPQTGYWKVERGHDKILGTEGAIAFLETRSRNAFAESDPLLIPVASLELACFDYAPVVRLQFSHRVGSNRTSTVHYRFDENPGRETSARFLQNYKTIVIEDKSNVVRFVDELRVSNKLHFRVVSHIAGTTTVDFNLKGATAAIDAAYSRCPLSSPPKQRTSALYVRYAWTG